MSARASSASGSELRVSFIILLDFIFIVTSLIFSKFSQI